MSAGDHPLEIVAYFRGRLGGKYASGDPEEDAFHGLVESPADLLPYLIEEVEASPDPDDRAWLVEVIWQRREPAAITFLGDVLRRESHRARAVWLAALDGLVALAESDGEAAVACLERSLVVASEEKRTWIAEAVVQAREAAYRRG